MAYIKGCAEAEALRLRQALDQLPDTTKMIEPSVGIVGWVYEDQLPEIYPYEEMFQFSVVDGVRMFPVYAPKAEPDMGIDRGAWDDVQDATKWVDELRGDEPEEWDHPPHRNCECKHCKEYWSDVYPQPKREWQGLTDDEWYDIWQDARTDMNYQAGREDAQQMIEAKLKERNT